MSRPTSTTYTHISKAGRTAPFSAAGRKSSRSSAGLGAWEFQRDAVGDQTLEPPEALVADAELFQVRDRLHQILRARAHMAAGLGQRIGDDVVGQPAGIALVIAIDGKGDGANLAEIGPDVEPAGHIDAGHHFTRPDALEDFRLLLRVDAIGDAAAHPALLQAEHQAGRLGRAAKTLHPEAELPVIAVRAADPPFNEGEVRLPDQRPVAENPDGPRRTRMR